MSTVDKHRAPHFLTSAPNCLQNPSQGLQVTTGLQVTKDRTPLSPEGKHIDCLKFTHRENQVQRGCLSKRPTTGSRQLCRAWLMAQDVSSKM